MDGIRTNRTLNRKNYQKLAGMISLALAVSTHGVAYANDGQKDTFSNFENHDELTKNAEIFADDMEFEHSTGLKKVNADEAYALGYTGKDIHVGVIESGLADIANPDLTSGVEVEFNNNGDLTNDTTLHATHVVGIIGARKNGDDENLNELGLNMHGIAHNAIVHSYAIAKDGTIADNGKFDISNQAENIHLNPSIKVANESFGSKEKTIKKLNDKILGNGTVIVESMGNEACVNPATQNDIVLNYKSVDNDEYKKNYILVVATDTHGKENEHLKLMSASNLAGDFSEIAISAPGTLINSTVPEDKVWNFHSGTSMAAPYVTGGIALVSQAFPYLSGKQLVDVVLSTANNDFDMPLYYFQTTDLGSSEHPKPVFNLVFTKDHTDADVDDVINEIYSASKSNLSNTYNIKDINEFKKKLNIVQRTKEEIFGQGLLDVGKAVQGLGTIDVKRLSESDKSNFYGLEPAYIYHVDTGKPEDNFNQRDYSIWSNDIGEKNGTGGLLKTGDVDLVLLGENTYTGPTVVTGGKLKIIRGVNGDVYASGKELTQAEKDLLNGNTLYAAEINGNAKNVYALRNGNIRISDTVTQKITNLGQNDSTDSANKEFYNKALPETHPVNIDGGLFAIGKNLVKNEGSIIDVALSEPTSTISGPIYQDELSKINVDLSNYAKMIVKNGNGYYNGDTYTGNNKINDLTLHNFGHVDLSQDKSYQTMTINNLYGSNGIFSLNTDWKNGIGDYLQINNAPNSTSHNLKIYDEDFTLGITANPLAVAMTPNTVTFFAYPTDKGVLQYTPIITPKVIGDKTEWLFGGYTSGGNGTNPYETYIEKYTTKDTIDGPITSTGNRIIDVEKVEGGNAFTINSSSSGVEGNTSFTNTGKLQINVFGNNSTTIGIDGRNGNFTSQQDVTVNVKNSLLQGKSYGIYNDTVTSIHGNLFIDISGKKKYGIYNTGSANFQKDIYIDGGDDNFDNFMGIYNKKSDVIPDLNIKGNLDIKSEKTQVQNEGIMKVSGSIIGNRIIMGNQGYIEARSIFTKGGSITNHDKMNISNDLSISNYGNLYNYGELKAKTINANDITLRNIGGNILTEKIIGGNLPEKGSISIRNEEQGVINSDIIKIEDKDSNLYHTISVSNYTKSKILAQEIELSAPHNHVTLSNSGTLNANCIKMEGHKTAATKLTNEGVLSANTINIINGNFIARGGSVTDVKNLDVTGDIYIVGGTANLENVKSESVLIAHQNESYGYPVTLTINNLETNELNDTNIQTDIEILKDCSIKKLDSNQNNPAILSQNGNFHINTSGTGTVQIIGNVATSSSNDLSSSINLTNSDSFMVSDFGSRSLKVQISNDATMEVINNGFAHRIGGITFATPGTVALYTNDSVSGLEHDNKLFHYNNITKTILDIGELSGTGGMFQLGIIQSNDNKKSILSDSIQIGKNITNGAEHTIRLLPKQADFLLTNDMKIDPFTVVEDSSLKNGGYETNFNIVPFDAGSYNYTPHLSKTTNDDNVNIWQVDDIHVTGTPVPVEPSDDNLITAPVTSSGSYSTSNHLGAGISALNSTINVSKSNTPAMIVNAIDDDDPEKEVGIVGNINFTDKGAVKVEVDNQTNSVNKYTAGIGTLDGATQNIGNTKNFQTEQDFIIDVKSYNPTYGILSTPTYEGTSDPLTNNFDFGGDLSVRAENLSSGESVGIVSTDDFSVAGKTDITVASNAGNATGIDNTGTMHFKNDVTVTGNGTSGNFAAIYSHADASHPSPKITIDKDLTVIQKGENVTSTNGIIENEENSFIDVKGDINIHSDHGDTIIKNDGTLHAKSLHMDSVDNSGNLAVSEDMDGYQLANLGGNVEIGKKGTFDHVSNEGTLIAKSLETDYYEGNAANATASIDSLQVNHLMNFNGSMDVESLSVPSNEANKGLAIEFGKALNINKSGKGTVKIDRDIHVGDNQALYLDLNNNQSHFSGEIMETDSSSVDFRLSNGAVWNVQPHEQSLQGKLSVNNGGTIHVPVDAGLNISSMSGTGGVFDFDIVQDAKGSGNINSGKVYVTKNNTENATHTIKLTPTQADFVLTNDVQVNPFTLVEDASVKNDGYKMSFNINDFDAGVYNYTPTLTNVTNGDNTELWEITDIKTTGSSQPPIDPSPSPANPSSGSTTPDTPSSGSGTAPSDTPSSGSGTAPSDTPSSGSGTAPSNTPSSGSGTAPSGTPSSGSGTAPSDTPSQKPVLSNLTHNVQDASFNNYYRWRNEYNNLNKRLGDLRDSTEDDGIWVRMFRGRQESGNIGMSNQFNAIQVGYDRKLKGKDGNWFVGGAFTSYNGNSHFAHQGNSEDRSLGLALYGSYLGNKGHYVDIVARHGRLTSDLTSYAAGTGAEITGKIHNWGTSFSAEYGRRIGLKHGFFVQPEVELTYGHVGGANYSLSDGSYVSQSGVSSWALRAGVRVGQKINDNSFYASLNYVKDFGDNSKFSIRDKYGKSYSESTDLGDSWWEVAVGGNLKLNDNSYCYAELEKTFGGNVQTKWQGNVGVRWSF